MSGDSSKNHYSSATHQRVQRSTTLNRKYVHRPEGRCHADDESSDSSPEISSFAKCQAENMRRRQELADKMNRERLAAMKRKSTQRRVVASEVTTKTVVHKPDIASAMPQHDDWATMPPAPSAKQLKDEAIAKAMRSVATMESQDKKDRIRAHKTSRARRNKRIAFAVACSVAAVAAIGYLVSTNLPDISMRVTAMQSGIADPYPTYVPRGFSLVTSTSSESSVQMTFSDNEGHKFVLTEEKSSWDSKTLLSSYVEKAWTSYDTVKEQGRTIYIWGSNAAWVSSGVKYTIESDSGVLTQKQIKNIAASLN